MTTVTIYDAARVDALLAAERLAARMNALPPRPRKDLITDTIAGLMAAGVWEKLDGLYVMAAHSEQAARLNWVGTGAQDLTNINGVVFDPNRGLQGDGATSYLSTGLNGNAGDHYRQDDAYLAIWVRSNFASDTAHDISGTGSSYINSRTVSGVLACRANNSSTPQFTGTVASSAGLSAFSRSSGAGFTVYKDAAVLGTSTSASDTFGSTQFWIGRNASNYSPRKYSAAVIGAALTDTEHATLHAILSTYLTAVGAI